MTDANADGCPLPRNSMELKAKDKGITFPRQPLVMGIVNLVADSFSGDGVVDIDQAVQYARTQVEQGADIIDIGAESARTNRLPISEAEEAGQLCAFLRAWDQPGVLLSVNTWRPAVARKALAVGGHILNDIGALPTDDNARICAQTGAALLIMHSVGTPKVPHTHVYYRDVLSEMEGFFEEKIAMAQRAGLAREALILDPGIDFAKQRDDNLAVYRHLERLKKFERPVLLPVSRKTVIGEVLGIDEARERDAGTVACIVSGMLRGASIFRVHNVRAAVQAIRTVHPLLGSASIG